MRRNCPRRLDRSRAPSGSRRLQRAPDPHRATPAHNAAHARGHSNRRSLTGGHRLLPALRVQIRAAQGAARRVWCNALAAFGAVARVHTGKGVLQACAAAKRSVRSVEEHLDQYLAGAETESTEPRAAHCRLATRRSARPQRRYSVTCVLGVAAYNQIEANGKRRNHTDMPKNSSTPSDPRGAETGVDWQGSGKPATHGGGASRRELPRQSPAEPRPHA
jgi:hypothetical protein